MRFASALLAVVVSVPAVASAQAPDSLSQQGRRILALGLGVTGTREASATAGGTEARATGALLSLGYSQFVGPVLAIDISAAALDADASVGYGNAEASAITALLLGLSYSPRSLGLTPAVRPFVSAAFGPYFHHQSDASGGYGGYSSIEAHAGARVGAGARFHVARHLALLVEGNYHVVEGFETDSGAKRDPSGLGLTFGLGFTWGR